MHVLDQAKRSAQVAELFIKEEEDSRVHLEGRQIQNIQVDKRLGRALRIFKDRRVGFAHTTRSGTEADANLLDHALTVSQYGYRTDYELPSETLSDWPVSTNQTLLDMAPDDYVRFAIEILELLKTVAPRLGWSIIVSGQRGRVQIINTKGLDSSYSFTGLDLLISGLYLQGNDSFHYHRQWKGNWGPTEVYRLVALVGKDFDGESKLLHVPATTYTIVFGPSAATTLLRCLTTPITGKNVAGLQARSAATEAEQLVDARISLVDDPVCSDGRFVRPFDDEGVATRQRKVIDNGRLIQGFHTLSSAATIGVEPTGNGFRSSYSKMPIPRPSNLSLEPGRRSISDIVAEVRDGIYVVALGGIAARAYQNGSLSGTITLGYRIINGERVGRINSAAVSLNGLEALRYQLIDIASERQWVDTALVPALVIDEVLIQPKSGL